MFVQPPLVVIVPVVILFIIGIIVYLLNETKRPQRENVKSARRLKISFYSKQSVTGFVKREGFAIRFYPRQKRD